MPRGAAAHGLLTAGTVLRAAALPQEQGGRTSFLTSPQLPPTPRGRASSVRVAHQGPLPAARGAQGLASPRERQDSAPPSLPDTLGRAQEAQVAL